MSIVSHHDSPNVHIEAAPSIAEALADVLTVKYGPATGLAEDKWYWTTPDGIVFLLAREML